METAYPGISPTCKKDKYKDALKGDDTVDKNHAKIFLLANKNLQTVLVTDLKSSTGRETCPVSRAFALFLCKVRTGTNPL
jgi:hypothetical protein